MTHIDISNLTLVKSFFGSHSEVRNAVGDYLIAASRYAKAKDTSQESFGALMAKAAALRAISKAILAAVDYANTAPLLRKADELEASFN